MCVTLSAMAPHNGNELFMTILGVVLGAIISIVTTVLIENWRRPKLRIRLLAHSDADYSTRPKRHATFARYLNVIVENARMPFGLRWLSRNAAMQCIGHISFHTLEGQDIFGRPMEARWGNSPEPVPATVIIDNKQGVIYDKTRLHGLAHVDILEGRNEGMNIAARFDDEVECWGWSNSSYFCQRLWRNDDWKLGRGTYLVLVVVRSAGAESANVFRLVTEASRDSFRLENATGTDRHAMNRYFPLLERVVFNIP
jgi:hypothetical protein